MTETAMYGEEWAVRILLECFLVHICALKKKVTSEGKISMVDQREFARRKRPPDDLYVHWSCIALLSTLSSKSGAEPLLN